MRRILLAAVLGALLGVLAAHLLVLQWWTLVPWGIAGILLGWWGREGATLALGAVYGFALVLAFMLTGYTGDRPVLGRMPFFAALGLFGAVCGLVLAGIGAAARRRLGTRGGA